MKSSWSVRLLQVLCGVRVRLTEVSTECKFIWQKIWEENFGTLASDNLIEGQLSGLWRLTLIVKHIDTITLVFVYFADLISNTAMAKKGRSSMAVSACFGGPLLSILSSPAVLLILLAFCTRVRLSGCENY